MKRRKSVTFTEKQVIALAKEAKCLTVSFAELIRQIVDKHLHD